jgi:hypothetical protein
MNRTPDIKYAEDAVGQIIDSATTSPEALLWLAQLKLVHSRRIPSVETSPGR